MQTTDTVTAWRRAGRSALRSLGRTGVMHPTPLLCFGMFLLLGASMVALSAVVTFRHMLAAQARVAVEIQPSAGDSEVQEFYAGLQGVRGVAGADLRSKEQALAEQRDAHPELAAFLDRYQLQNPFPDAFVIRLSDVGGFAALRTFLSDEKWKTLLDASTPVALAEQEATLLRLQVVIDTLGRAAGLFTGALLLLALFLFADVTWSRLSHRADERRMVACMGGGWVESDGSVALEVMFMLWAALIAAAVTLTGLVASLPTVLRTTGADAAVTAFLVSLRAGVMAELPSVAGAAFLLVPVAALMALWLAWLVPARRLG